MYAEDDFLLISGIQHFRFCRRQWALIHVEDQWAENVRTVEGEALHRKAHDATARERRGDLLIVRGMRVASHRLGISGTCDVVEFRRDPSGVPLHGEEGRYLPFPIEYKHGSGRSDDADELQQRRPGHVSRGNAGMRDPRGCTLPRGDPPSSAGALHAGAAGGG